MMCWHTVVLCLAISATALGLKFPPEFKFGVATAAYQIEGAWNVSDKGESIWDRMLHSNPAATADGLNADVGVDSYHLWRRDVDMLEELGVHYYRFSVSWPRLLPNGFSNAVSEDGARYYNELIDGLLERGIEPYVTLYHWDLPQALQDLGGWTNPLVADWFTDYARVAYTLFGDRVKTWITLNEPMVFCDIAYNTGIMAPGIVFPEIAPYLCNKNALVAHAKAWRVYDEEFRKEQKGRVSLSNHLIWFEPETPEDEDLAELARENIAGRYAHAIFSKTGGWPPSIERQLAEISKEMGLPRSKLPAFTKEEVELVKGTYDFFGMNHYTSRLIRPAKEGEVLEPWPLGDAPDLKAKLLKHPDWETCKSFWFYIYPEGIRRQMAWLKQQYGDIEILITENGYAGDGSSGLNDPERVRFHKRYLKNVLLSIVEDGVNVTGYTAWTLLDNFEWMDGFTTKFGLYEVDFDSPDRKRRPRMSAKFYSKLIQAHAIDINSKL